MLVSSLTWALQHGVTGAVVGVAARRGDPQARLIVDEDVRHDPYPLLREVRESGRLVKGRLSYLTTTHAVAKDILRSDDMAVGFNPSGPRSAG